jgi:hypothetical protein
MAKNKLECLCLASILSLSTICMKRLKLMHQHYKLGYLSLSNYCHHCLIKTRRGFVPELKQSRVFVIYKQSLLSLRFWPYIEQEKWQVQNTLAY